MEANNQNTQRPPHAYLIPQAGASLGSLGGYALARAVNIRFWYPFVMVGGVLGAIAGEGICEMLYDPKKKKQ